MHAIISNSIGRIHHAAGHPDLRRTRPVFCWVPEEFFDADGFQRGRYLVSRWPSINCSANPLAVGSHVIPDVENPVNIRSRCPVLREFLVRLEQLASIKKPIAA
jgi:hypothetical protein